jgi:hypothetical protein
VAVKEIGEELFSDLEVRRPDLEISVVETPLFGRLWAPESLDEYMALVQCGTLADQPLSTHPFREAWRVLGATSGARRELPLARGCGTLGSARG